MHVRNGHTDRVEPQVLTKTPQEVTQAVLGNTFQMGPRYKLALAFFGLLLVLGIIGFALRARDGFDSFRPWAYFMATYAFLLTTASSAPLLSVTQRMLKSHWRRPLARASEMFAIVGVLSTLMFIPLVLLLPSAENRKTIWFEWPGTPLFSDLLAVIFLGVLGLAILYVGAVPDLAAARDHSEGGRRAWLRRLTLGWRGTDQQWKALRAGLGVLGALYFTFLIFVHTIIAADFAEALVPGWKDSLFPAYHALSGLQSAIASTLLALFLLHRIGGFKDYIAVDQFWGASKILLALTLLWAYFWFSGFIVFWYGRQPVEQSILKNFMFEAYRFPFLMAVFLNFLVPFAFLIWNFVRKSMLGPTIVSVSILVGTLFDRIRIYVASFNIADAFPEGLSTLHPEPLATVVNPVLPNAADVLIIIGGIGGAIFLYLLAMKFIPVLSIWEIKEGILYRVRRPFLKTHVMVMGKPD